MPAQSTANPRPTRQQFVRLCDCGCGQPTRLAAYTSRNQGWVKGRPLRYIRFHVGTRVIQAVDVRFWSKVDRSGRCWLWLAGFSSNGYGEFSVRSRKINSHVFAYELTHGPVPKGMVVRHKCDNKACCNPAHLLLGTHEDNVRDMVDRGRSRNGTKSGEDHPRAVLNHEQVREIRRRHAAGESQGPLGREFGIASSTIWGIVHGTRYKIA